jgi:hypothetical protein
MSVMDAGLPTGSAQGGRRNEIATVTVRKFTQSARLASHLHSPPRDRGRSASTLDLSYRAPLPHASPK